MAWSVDNWHCSGNETTSFRLRRPGFFKRFYFRNTGEASQEPQLVCTDMPRIKGRSEDWIFRRGNKCFDGLPVEYGLGGFWTFFHGHTKVVIEKIRLEKKKSEDGLVSVECFLERAGTGYRECHFHAQTTGSSVLEAAVKAFIECINQAEISISDQATN